MKRLITRLIRIDHWIDQKIQSASFGFSVPFFKGISKEFSFVLAFLLPIFGILLERDNIWAVVWIAGVATYLTTKGIKRWTGRKRPQEDHRTSVHLDQESGSFPSRHVSVLAAEGMVLLLTGSTWTLAWFLAVFLVALARVGLREHFFTDVLFGFVWGMLNGWLVELIKGVVTS